MYYKYPKTFHVPWSLSINSDDKVFKNIDHFENKRVIVSEKMDGENTAFYSDFLHARSIDSKQHESRSWVKNFHSQIKYFIPDGWRIYGENLFAKHQIEYNSLQSYFYGFAIYNENNICLSYDDTINFFNKINILHVPVLYDGIYNEILIKNIYKNITHDCEGYVIRMADSFHYNDFKNNMAKFVRKNHVPINEKHWFNKEVIVNQLAK